MTSSNVISEEQAALGLPLLPAKLRKPDKSSHLSPKHGVTVAQSCGLEWNPTADLLSHLRLHSEDVLFLFPIMSVSVSLGKLRGLSSKSHGNA